VCPENGFCIVTDVVLLRTRKMSKKKFRSECIKIYVNDTVGSVVVEWYTPYSYELRENLTKGFYGQNENELIRWIGMWNWKVKQN
jgi:hypothetical protein